MNVDAVTRARCVDISARSRSWDDDLDLQKPVEDLAIEAGMERVYSSDFSSSKTRASSEGEGDLPRRLSAGELSGGGWVHRNEYQLFGRTGFTGASAIADTCLINQSSWNPSLTSKKIPVSDRRWLIHWDSRRKAWWLPQVFLMMRCVDVLVTALFSLTIYLISAVLTSCRRHHFLF